MSILPGNGNVKNIEEVLLALEVLLVNTKNALKDGKIDFSDVQYLVNLVNSFGVFENAVKNVNEIPSEIKDIDAAEAQQLLLKIFQIIGKLK